MKIDIKQKVESSISVLYVVNGFTATESEMGDFTLSLTLRLPIKKVAPSPGADEVDVNTPNFATSWYVEYNGEVFYLSTTKPEAVKSTDSLDYEYKLIFNSERSELKKRIVRNLATSGADIFVSQGTVFSPYLNLEQFQQLINNNLLDCFGTVGVDGTPKWRLDLSGSLTTIQKKNLFVTLNVSNSYIWDLLLKVYELFGFRWRIMRSGETLVIMVGYDIQNNELIIPKVFKYGSNDGLTKIARISPDTRVINRLRGTGGTRNLPVNYFKSTLSGNGKVGFPNDPNPITGIFQLPNLMPRCFRDSVIAGTTPYIDYYELNNTNYLPSMIVEDALAPNEDIYPSIENVYKNSDNNYVVADSPAATGGIGRLDVIVGADTILVDNPDDNSTIASVADVVNSSGSSKFSDLFVIGENEVKDISAKLLMSYSDEFENLNKPETSFIDKAGNTHYVSGLGVTMDASVALVSDAGDPIEGYDSIDITKTDINKEIDILFKSVPAGSYKLRLNTSKGGTISYSSEQVPTPSDAILDGNSNPIYTYDNSGKLVYRTANGWEDYPDADIIQSTLNWSVSTNLFDISDSAFSQTFNIWVKDIGFNLAEVDDNGLSVYASTEDAKISFKTGRLAGYEFTILKNGNTFACEVDEESYAQSKYKITLIKSEDEYRDGRGNMLPNSSVYPEAADQFVILNIQMPQVYVEFAESKLYDYLITEFNKVSIEYPAYQVDISDIFIKRYDDNAKLRQLPTLSEKLRGGNVITIADERLISGQINLFINAITYDNTGLLTKYKLTVTDKVTSGGSVVQRIQAQIDLLSSGGSSSTASQLSMDNRYLKKNAEDIAYEPITFEKGAIVSSIRTNNFEQGQLMGTGGAIYRDVDGDTMLEVDKIMVRKKAYFNELLINQIKYQGGTVIYSCASMEVSAYADNKLYFDTKGNTIQNLFAHGDQIRCQRFVSSKVLKYYMAVVKSVGQDYIEIYPSSSYEISNPTVGEVNIEVGDIVVQFGSRTNPLRQSLIELNVTQGGKQTFYQNISSFDLTDRNYVDIGMLYDTTDIFSSTPAWRNLIRVYGDAYIGERSQDSYFKYDSARQRVTIKGDVTVLNPLTDEYVDIWYYIYNLTQTLKNQADNSLVSWFYNVDPATENLPASDWSTTQLKTDHIGDTYTNKITYDSWQWTFANNAYSWEPVTDPGIIQALIILAKENASLDGRVKSFTTQPTTPYSAGDIWVNATYTGVFNNDLARCQTSRASGDFAIADWIKASKYTDDTLAQSAIDTLADIAADGKITPDEKLRVLAEWNAIYSEFNPIHGLGVNSLIGGIDNSYCSDYRIYYYALEDYLFAGDPVILNVDVTSTVMRQTTVIDRDVFMDKFVDYYSYKALLQAQISGLGSTALSLLDDISSDGKITPDEKLTVLGIMDAIDAEFTPLYVHGEAVIGEKDEFGNQIDAALVQFSEAHNLLHAYLFHPDNPATIDTILSASDAKIYLNGVETANYVMKTTTSITRSDFMYKFREYYAKKALVQTEINASISESLLEIEKIADDGWLTPAEKSQLSLRWKDIMSEFSSITGKCALYDMLELDAGQYVDEFYSQYYASYSGLNTYLTNVVNGILSVDVNITTSIDKAEFISYFQSYYDNREIIIDALDNKDKDSLGALDYLKEALKTDPGQEGLPGTDIGLLWSKILLMRDSNLIQRGGMSGLATDKVGFWTGGTYAQAYEDADKPFKSVMETASLDNKLTGAGHKAFGNLAWDANGNLFVKGLLEVINGGKIGNFTIEAGDIIGRNSSGATKIKISTEQIPTLTDLTSGIIYTGGIFEGETNWVNNLQQGYGTTHQFSNYVEGYISIPYTTTAQFTSAQENVTVPSGMTLTSAIQTVAVFKDDVMYFNGAVDTDFSIEGGLYKVRHILTVTLSDPQQNGGTCNSGFNAQTSRGVQYSESVGYSAIGTNGLFSMFSTSSYIYYKSDYGIVFRYGSYGIRMTSSGLQKTTTGDEGWTAL